MHFFFISFRAYRSSVCTAACRASTKCSHSTSIGSSTVSRGTSLLCISRIKIRLRLFLYHSLFESFIVHIKIAHRFLFRSRGYATKFGHECRVINLQFILDSLFFIGQIRYTLCVQLLALNFMAVKR